MGDRRGDEGSGNDAMDLYELREDFMGLDGWGRGV